MQSNIRTLIVDDEEIARHVLREELGLITDVEVVGEADNGKDALQQIHALEPDLVLLDLQMPLMGGFEVIRNIRVTHLPVVVIVTAFNQHAIEAFEAGAVDYLLKPVRAERLQRTVHRARDLIGRPRQVARDLARMTSLPNALSPLAAPAKLVGRVGREYFLLDADEVLALQAEGELVWIVTPERRFLGTQTLRAIESRLPGSSFLRVHRNAIVNVKYVRKMSALTSNRWLMTLSNELQFVVSKRQAHSVRRVLQW